MAFEMSGSGVSVKLTLLSGTPTGMGGDWGGEPPGEPGGRFTDRPTSMGSLKTVLGARGVSTIIGIGEIAVGGGAAAGVADGGGKAAADGANESASASAC
jgi:hypothetical protein